MYLPDVPRQAYQDLLDAPEQEFTYTFGGCTTLRGLEGNYLSRLGLRMRDRINLIYTDTAFPFDEHFARIERYADELRSAAFEALEEEAGPDRRLQGLSRGVRLLLSSYPAFSAGG